MPSDTSPKHVKCPDCQGFDVRRSWPAGIWDKVQARRGKTPLRCRGCGCRFYYKLTGDEKLGIPDPSESKDAVI